MISKKNKKKDIWVEDQFSIVSPFVDWLMFRLFFFFYWIRAHICGTLRVAIFIISTFNFYIRGINNIQYRDFFQNNESSCLTLVALVHCVLRATSLSLDPPGRISGSKPITVICTEIVCSSQEYWTSLPPTFIYSDIHPGRCGRLPGPGAKCAG